MLTLNDGRSELWQWDTGRKLSVDADCTQVHFSNKVFGRSVDVDVVDGVAIIPDILLQVDKDLTAWAFVGTPENGYTKISKIFKVNKRNKPADYVFTEQDQTTLGEILNRIEDLENRPSGDISKEDIQDAVNEYLDNNPVSVNETDPTVPDWAKQPSKPTYTASEVKARPDDWMPSAADIGAQPVGNYATKDEIPTTLPNPNALTFTGAVDGTYDGSAPLTVNIPTGGGSSEWELLAEGSFGANNSNKLAIDLSSYPEKEEFFLKTEFRKTTEEITPQFETNYVGSVHISGYKTSVYAQTGTAYIRKINGVVYGRMSIMHGWGFTQGIGADIAPSPRGGNGMIIYASSNPFADIADYGTFKFYGR